MAGNIARRPNGKWRARYRDESGRERARHFDRKRDARRWLDQVTSSIITGNYIDPGAGSITFVAFYDEWSVRQLWAPGTVAAMSLAARSVPFGGKAIRQVRRSDIETWVKAMDTAGLAPGTIKTRYVNVRSVFRAATRERLITIDPTDEIRLPRRRRPAAAMSIPTTEDVGLLIASAEPRERALFALCAFAGLRLGEAVAIQFGDVDIGNRSLKVLRQVQRAGAGSIEVRAPKYGSERVVQLADGLIKLIELHMIDHGTQGGDRWLFGAGGSPPDQGVVGYRWRKATRAAGIHGTKVHDLRHFYASGLIAAGCDVVTVQHALGHATTTTTLNTYAHLWPSAENRTGAAMQAILTDSLGSREHQQLGGVATTETRDG